MISTRIAFVISCVIFLLMATFTGSIWWAIFVAAFVFVFLILLGLIARKWGEKGVFWGIIPTNKMICKEHYGILTDVYARPDSEATVHFMAWKLAKETGNPVEYNYFDDEGTPCRAVIRAQKASYKIHLINRKSGLIWLGWPWADKIRAFPWSMFDDPKKDTRHSIFFGHYTVDWPSEYLREGKKPDSASGGSVHGVPVYKTGDLIDAASSLRCIMQVLEYERFGYKLPYPKDTLRDLILGVWREEVLAKHRFFTEALLKHLNGKEDFTQLDLAKMLGQYQPEILQVAQKHLNVSLGIAKWAKKKDESGNLKTEDDIEAPIEFISNPGEFPLNTVARQVYDDYGVRIVRVAVTDLEEVGKAGSKPGDMTVGQHLEELLKTSVSRRTGIVKADGERKIAEIKGNGIMKQTRAEISAYETNKERLADGLDNYHPSDSAIKAFLQAKGLNTLGDMKADKTIFFGSPGGQTLAEVITGAGAFANVGKEAVSSGKEGGEEK